MASPGMRSREIGTLYYHRCKELVKGRSEPWVEIDANTVLVRRCDGSFAVCLHEHMILLIERKRNGEVQYTVDSCGFLGKLTQSRINALAPLGIYKKPDGTWFARFKTGTEQRFTVPFTDGLKVSIKL